MRLSVCLSEGPIGWLLDEEDVIIAGSDLDWVTFRRGTDVSFPASPPKTYFNLSSLDHWPTRYLLTFQGRATHLLRLHLATLHNGNDVIIRVGCMVPSQSPHCLAGKYGNIPDMPPADDWGEEEGCVSEGRACRPLGGVDDLWTGGGSLCTR